MSFLSAYYEGLVIKMRVAFSGNINLEKLTPLNRDHIPKGFSLTRLNLGML